MALVCQALSLIESGWRQARKPDLRAEMIAPSRTFRTARIIQFGIPKLSTDARRRDDRL